VDGSEGSDRAVRLLIGLYKKLAPVEVRVLHVQVPVLLAGDALSRQEAVESHSADGGKDALRSAQTLLDGAGIPYISEIRRGYVAHEVARYAKDLNCTGIIMGTRGMGTTDEILGSIVRQVVALTSIPVTLVK
jgi:nucleotide-binding universal stress UspA family protein